jgi:hypothetical protein
MNSNRIKVSLAFALLAGLLGLCGCAHQYLLKLRDGDQIFSLTKPRSQGTNYFFTDGTGTPCVLPRSRVVQIRAVSPVNEEQQAASPAKPKKPKHWYFLWLD